MGSKGFKISKVFKRVALGVATVGASEAVRAASDVLEEPIKGITGITAADQAKKEADKQDALIAKEEAAIEEKRLKTQKVTDERKARMSKNQLLVGSETGKSSKTTLLGVS